MKPAAIRTFQSRLKKAGLYTSAINGRVGPKTDEAIARALAGRSGKLPADWNNWPDRRKRVACLQLLATEAGLDAGIIDGFWGPQTAFAAEGPPPSSAPFPEN